MKIQLNWEVGFCDSKEERPSEYFEAKVPGAVQLDYAKKYDLPDYRKGLNFKAYKWMEDKYWVYRTMFQAKNLKIDEQLFLVINGIDYAYEIYANGVQICKYEGMYRKQRLDLSHEIGKEIIIEIIVFPAPKSGMWDVHPDCQEEANQTCKPAVSYRWDFHPRLIPLGIWEDIYLEKSISKEPFAPCVSYKLSGNLSSALVSFAADGFEETKWQFYSPDGTLLFENVGAKIEYEIKNVELWWCNGYGKQPLYKWVASADNTETVERKMGFKKVQIVKAPGSWSEGLTYPASRNTPPITVKLNHEIIFAKGTNWVCPEIFYGTVDYERYSTQLKLIQKANLNFVRCWGGAIVNKDSFFDICDELGLLVWQEFPLACNNYHGTEDYISLLYREASDIIDKIKAHVCLMLWCGGNELFNNWSCMTEQDAAIRLLNKLTFEKTPQIPFIPTAPVMGMAHGPYCFNTADGREIIDVFIHSHNTAYTEFGNPGFSTEETLSAVDDLKNLIPFTNENEIVYEHGRQWIDYQLDSIERYFGKIDDVHEQIKYGQLLQSIGLQFVFEEARRQKPYCSMAANWCFNEPWPNTANNSLVSYPNSIKPAYYYVAKACRSVLASARYRKLSYVAGEYLEFDLFLLNDSFDEVQDGSVEVCLKIGDCEKIKLLKWDYQNVKKASNVAGPTIRYLLPHIDDADYMEISLECGEYSSNYYLLYRVPEKPLDAPKKMNAILDENVIE